MASNANITRHDGHAEAEAAQNMSNDPDGDGELVLQCGQDEAILRYIIRTASDLIKPPLAAASDIVTSISGLLPDLPAGRYRAATAVPQEPVGPHPSGGVRAVGLGEA